LGRYLELTDEVKVEVKVEKKAFIFTSTFTSACF